MLHLKLNQCLLRAIAFATSTIPKIHIIKKTENPHVSYNIMDWSLLLFLCHAFWEILIVSHKLIDWHTHTHMHTLYLIVPIRVLQKRDWFFLVAKSEKVCMGKNFKCIFGCFISSENNPTRVSTGCWPCTLQYCHIYFYHYYVCPISSLMKVCY